MKRRTNKRNVETKEIIKVTRRNHLDIFFRILCCLLLYQLGNSFASFFLVFIIFVVVGFFFSSFLFDLTLNRITQLEMFAPSAS